MTRINSKTVQRVDDDAIVIADDSTGEEIVLTNTEAAGVLQSLRYFLDEEARGVRGDIRSAIDEAETIEQAVTFAVGAASVCWKPMNGTGVFDSKTASEIVDALVARIRRPEEAS